MPPREPPHLIYLPRVSRPPEISADLSLFGGIPLTSAGRRESFYVPPIAEDNRAYPIFRWADTIKHTTKCGGSEGAGKTFACMRTHDIPIAKAWGLTVQWDIDTLLPEGRRVLRGTR